MRVLALLLIIAAVAAAQNPPDWRKVGGASVNLTLASPATGPVERVWFSPGGSTLFARTQSGKVFVTADFVSWSPVTDPEDAPAVTPATAVRLPETGAAIIAASDPATIFGLGRQVSRSQDGGHTWVNLTGYHGRAVIGPTQRSVAVSPVDPDQLVVANDYGVWRSLDGGATWAGLNQNLPNLSVERYRFDAHRRGWNAHSEPPAWASRIAALFRRATGVGQVATDSLAADAASKDRYSRMLGTEILSVASSKNALYAGSADGRIFASQDGGSSFDMVSPYKADGPVESIFAAIPDWKLNVKRWPRSPEMGSSCCTWREQYVTWHALDSPSLPSAPAHGITADQDPTQVACTDKARILRTCRPGECMP